jgi:hypothetical protein
MVIPLQLVPLVIFYVARSKSFGNSEIAHPLDVLAMPGKLRCLVAYFLIIILLLRHPPVISHCPSNIRDGWYHEQHINIKFCFKLEKTLTETVK